MPKISGGSLLLDDQVGPSLQAELLVGLNGRPSELTHLFDIAAHLDLLNLDAWGLGFGFDLVSGTRIELRCDKVYALTAFVAPLVLLLGLLYQLLVGPPQNRQVCLLKQSSEVNLLALGNPIDQAFNVN